MASREPSEDQATWSVPVSPSSRPTTGLDHYWVPCGYAAKAPIKLQSRIDAPRGLDRIAPGPFVIGGVAWAQTTGIRAVEVRIDETEWVEATLADEMNTST